MATISLVMIVKNEEAILRRCVDSVKSIIDDFVIVDTGSTDRTREIIAEYGPVVEIPFVDFVTTKNEALDLATGDYVLFMDADEFLLSGLDALKAYADAGDYDAVSALIAEGPPDRHDITANRYHRYRLWRNRGYRFAGPGCHEVIDITGARTVRDESIIVRHAHDKPGKANQYPERARLYESLLLAATEKNPGDTRAWFYLARTYAEMNLPLKAADTYRRYLSIEGNAFVDERWQAAYDMAMCYKTVGEYGKAEVAAKEAVEIDWRRAEAFNLIGQLQYNQGEFEAAARAFETAAALPMPEGVVLFMDPQAYGPIPLDYLVLCYERMGDVRRAAVAARGAMLSSARVFDRRKLENYQFTWARLSMTVFMLLGSTPEPVYGGIIGQQGVGGVETTYVELSRCLAALGHTVFLFCACPKAHKYDGVYYVPWTEARQYAGLRPDISITSRWYEPLYWGMGGKKLIWFQDAFFADPDRPDAFQQCDLAVCSSPWHRQYIAERLGLGLEPEKIHIIPLGIDHNLFAQRGTERRDPWKMIYSSNPDRGLFILLDMWEEITRRFPEIHLDVYYGWEGLSTWRGDDEWKRNIADQQARCQAAVDRYGNIRFTGRLKKADLAAEMSTATLCLYPNNFFETFCLTALECQAAGVPSVSSDIGALATTYDRAANVLVGGDPFSTEYKANYLSACIELLEDRVRLAEMSRRCRDFALNRPTDWSDIATQWVETVYANSSAARGRLSMQT